ncbi:DUF1963 domain-containing protein [Streptomyces sp. ISL-12]|uniref:DUF1963 domain-containing protein n=1 Tax=Streptomyces sp. ISL-12 TaxID=2819177 RepID=UPI001BEC1ABA|nr:DUF1963 domain-containing protein [Streptomyces sp. ISL-12]MBT2413328.1 DUF1963 domain-containing protein [Streptomyces sp. ISL-12]
MRPEILRKLDRVREKALTRGVPLPDIDRWLAAARPCATLAPQGNGPVVGRFGGPALLPTAHPELPQRTYLIASLDLAALPSDATTLPLPSDGRLLLFARSYDDGLDADGEAVYVPAGTPVGQRPLAPGYASDDAWAGLEEGLRSAGGELRLRHDVSLPDNASLFDPAEHPRAEDLRDAWREVQYEDRQDAGTSHLQLDGYSSDPYRETDLVTASAWQAARKTGQAPRPADWALLAQWHGAAHIDGDVYWTIRKRDAAAGRFDAVTVLGFFEGPV